ncbi:MAG: hypothetical protein ACF8CY_06790 [Gimesia chilikensis]
MQISEPTLVFPDVKSKGVSVRQKGEKTHRFGRIVWEGGAHEFYLSEEQADEFPADGARFDYVFASYKVVNGKTYVDYVGVGKPVTARRQEAA